MQTQYKSVDEYIADFEPEIRERLETIRFTIMELAPEAQELINYGIPTFKLHGNLIHFGGFKNHVSLFPGASGVNHFINQLTKYKTSKGAIQFKHDQPIPVELIKKITKFRIKENLERAKAKSKKK